MQIHETISSMRTARRNSGRLALIPTMGNLHEGHITLMRQAHEHADDIVASIFVNRLQFGPKEDFERYPRTFDHDVRMMQEAGVTHVFAPHENEMYPQPQRYYIDPPPEQAAILEGQFRPGHFRGVATVVLKLLNIVQPDIVLFGKKDYQQLMVLSNMVRELALPVEILPADTVRAPDGLALSSRNGYLSEEERAEAPYLYQILEQTRDAVHRGRSDFQALEKDAMAQLTRHGWLPDYVNIRRRADLQFPSASGEPLVVLGAATLGSTRLIDNLEI